MCQAQAQAQAQERPQRRHRAAYLAPSAGPFHPTTPAVDDQQVIPFLVEFPSHPMPISPPSSGELSPMEFDFVAQTSQIISGHQPKRLRVLNACFTLFHWFVDFLMLVAVCVMGCFFYDVEMKMVKADRQRSRARGRSGRVVIRTNNPDPGLTTSLLRTPPRSGASRSRGYWSRSSASPRSRENYNSWDGNYDTWDVV